MTTVQSEDLTGNGVQAQVGNIRAENLTLVLGPEGTSSATLITRIVNGNQDETDRLIGVQIAGIPAEITGKEVELDPGTSTGFGFESDLWINAEKFTADVSTYVPVALQFERSGIAQAEVLVVPPLGYYEGIEPVQSAE